MPNYRIALVVVLLAPWCALAQTANQALNDELIIAARKSNVEAVKELLAKGADVNAKTEYGATPLFFACDRGNVEIVKLLLAAGADTEIRDTFYKSNPVSWAVQRDQSEIVKLLVEKKPASKEPTTAMAVSMGQTKTVETLLTMGDFKPESLTMWLTIAEKNGYTEVVEALKKAGAKPKPKVDFKVDEATLKTYEGVYKNDRFEFKFVVKGGKLMMSTPDGFDSDLIPTAQHTFDVDKAIGAILTFTVEGGNVTGLTWKNGGGELVLKKEAK
ncbi:MAG: ankyrin repeat domain-containing protein [Acidobacteria bacterium]|nr:ankyrin repeat domain-containing protein [Acidobacteriota bacterium]